MSNVINKSNDLNVVFIHVLPDGQHFYFIQDHARTVMPFKRCPHKFEGGKYYVVQIQNITFPDGKPTWRWGNAFEELTEAECRELCKSYFDEIVKPKKDPQVKLNNPNASKLLEF